MELTVLKIFEIDVPIVVRIVIAAIATSAAMSAYSIMVTPAFSAMNRFIDRSIVLVSIVMVAQLMPQLAGIATDNL